MDGMDSMDVRTTNNRVDGLASSTKPVSSRKTALTVLVVQSILSILSMLSMLSIVSIRFFECIANT